MNMRSWLIMSVALVVCASNPVGAEEGAFHTSREAMQWLARELPRLTRANPKYQTKSDGTVSQWLTKVILFSRDRAGHVQVAMDESYTQVKAGVSTPGRHKAAFSLADVDISDLTQPDDVTPEGEPARGVLFTCKTPGCVAAVWGGQPSKGDKTDIYIKDDAGRAKALAAFRLLAAHAD